VVETKKSRHVNAGIQPRGNIRWMFFVYVVATIPYSEAKRFIASIKLSFSISSTKTTLCGKAVPSNNLLSRSSRNSIIFCSVCVKRLMASPFLSITTFTKTMPVPISCHYDETNWQECVDLYHIVSTGYQNCITLEKNIIETDIWLYIDSPPPNINLIKDQTLQIAMPQYFIENQLVTIISEEETGLHKRNKVGRLPDGKTVILIDRKSRLIMKDGEKALALAMRLKQKGFKYLMVSSSAPVCSKTSAFLKENNIDVKPLDKEPTCD